MKSEIRRFMLLWAMGMLLLSLPVISACGNNALTISPAELPDAQLYQPYQATVTITGEKTPVGGIGVGSGALPDGLKITYEEGNNTASISGDPTLLGTFSFTISASCKGTNKQGQSGQQKYVIVVTR
jgi:hypothetical protein